MCLILIVFKQIPSSWPESNKLLLEVANMRIVMHKRIKQTRKKCWAETWQKQRKTRTLFIFFSFWYLDFSEAKDIPYSLMLYSQKKSSHISINTHNILYAVIHLRPMDNTHFTNHNWVYEICVRQLSSTLPHSYPWWTFDVF